MSGNFLRPRMRLPADNRPAAISQQLLSRLAEHSREQHAGERCACSCSHTAPLAVRRPGWTATVAHKRPPKLGC
jgi:hypothetical protein